MTDHNPPAATGIDVSIRGLAKSFGGKRVLADIDLDIRPGSFVAVVGHSGCGKSTLLRLIAGLETPDAGGVTLGASGRPAGTSDVRVMFQEPRLLPWKRVLDNVVLGLPRDRREAGSRRLAEVGLADRGDEWPSRLSGGQKQRVALARALGSEPGLLLLDEPLGALDALTRIEMQRLIGDIWRQHRFTAILVTHDVAEAVTLAERVLYMADGGVALDLPVALPHPRTRSGDFAYYEKTILDRILGATESAVDPVQI